MTSKRATFLWNQVRGIAYGITSGLFVSLAFPSFGLSYFAFFGFVPLFIAIEKLTLLPSLLATVFFVLTLYSYMMSWLDVFHPLALPGVLLYLSFVHIVPVLIYKYFKKNTETHGNYNAIFLALLLCSMEFLRGIGFTRFPYGNIAYSQYEFLSFIQIAEIVGYLGISFYIYLSNAYIAQFYTHLHFFIDEWNLFRQNSPKYLKIVKSRFAIMAMLFIFIVAYGFTRIDYFDEVSKVEKTSILSVTQSEEEKDKNESSKITYTRSFYSPLTVRLVQPWFDYNQNWNDKNQAALLEKLTRLSTETDPENQLKNTDLIIWPESALLDYYEYRLNNSENSYSHEFKRFFENFSKNNSIPFLTGSLSVRDEKILDNPLLNETPSKANENTENAKVQRNTATNQGNVQSAKDAKTKGIKTERRKYNASLFLKPNGEVHSTSGKVYLVPFAEYFPYKEFLEKSQWLKRILSEAQASNFSPFPQKKVFFDQNIVPFASMICYEDCFDDLASTYTLSGAKFLVVITNDAWSYSVRSQELHYMFSVLRAIENRRPILRVANAGVTGLVNASGKLQHSLPMFEEGKTTFMFRPLSYKAFYTDLGITIVSLFMLSFIFLYIPYLFLKKIFKFLLLLSWAWLKNLFGLLKVVLKKLKQNLKKKTNTK